MIATVTFKKSDVDHLREEPSQKLFAKLLQDRAAEEELTPAFTNPAPAGCVIKVMHVALTEHPKTYDLEYHYVFENGVVS